MIYITGAYGFIGTYLCRELPYRKLNYRVCNGLIEQIRSNDLVGCDTVVHLAALKDRAESFRKPIVLLPNADIGVLRSVAKPLR